MATEWLAHRVWCSLAHSLVANDKTLNPVNLGVRDKLLGNGVKLGRDPLTGYLARQIIESTVSCFGRTVNGSFI
jgi:hypothetical protein